MPRHERERCPACSSSHASLHDVQSLALLPQEDRPTIRAWSKNHPRLDGPYRGRNIEVTTEEYDRQRRTEFTQPRLEFRTAYPRHPHVKDNTAWSTFARQAIQQVLGRSVGGDLVTGYRQTTFHRCSEGHIVIDNMHAPLHKSLPEKRLKVSRDCNLV